MCLPVIVTDTDGRQLQRLHGLDKGEDGGREGEVDVDDRHHLVEAAEGTQPVGDHLEDVVHNLRGLHDLRSLGVPQYYYSNNINVL